MQQSFREKNQRVCIEKFYVIGRYYYMDNDDSYDFKLYKSY